jgi:hypothetical protein
MVDQDVINMEATKLAFGLAKDLSVQLLTLGSALIGLTVVLSKDIKKSHNTLQTLLVLSVLAAYRFYFLRHIRAHEADGIACSRRQPRDVHTRRRERRSELADWRIPVGDLSFHDLRRHRYSRALAKAQRAHRHLSFGQHEDGI